MNRPILFSALVVVIAALFPSCGRQGTTASAVSSGATEQSPPRESAAAAERKKEDDEVRARTRREHPDWSEKQISDYVKGYSLFGISPETYAKTRSVLDGARSLRCQFPRGSYVDLADPNLARHEGAAAEVTFDAIDRKRGHARVIAENGAGDVTVITGPTALTFIEVAATGNPLVTVVFPRFRAGTRAFYAADSEHVFAFGISASASTMGAALFLNEASVFSADSPCWD